jgi:hypothetical protein
VRAEVDTDETAEQLLRLRRVIRTLRRYGQLAVAFTLMNAAALFWGILGSLFIRIPVGIYAMVVSGAASFVVLLITAMFDSVRRQGRAVFEELVDELQWYSGTEAGRTNLPSLPREASEIGRPSLGTRITIREFARSSDLPLIPGHFGPLLYCAGNVAIFVILVVWLRTVFKY